MLPERRGGVQSSWACPFAFGVTKLTWSIGRLLSFASGPLTATVTSFSFSCQPKMRRKPNWIAHPRH
jgi:hypothetical protein